MSYNGTAEVTDNRDLDDASLGLDRAFGTASGQSERQFSG